MAEARWWLGRSFEQLGDYRAAMAEYRTLAAAEAGGESDQQLYRAHALRRLDELRQMPSVAQTAPGRQIAVGLSVAQVPAVSEWVSWFQSLIKSGVTALLVDPALSDGVAGEEVERVQTLVGAAHLAGLAVWISLDLHQGRGLPVQSEWITMAVGRSQGSSNWSVADPTSMVHPDVLHPGYQAAVEERAKVLLRTGCDGMLLQAREGQGFAKEYSEASYQLFASAFAVTISPQQLLGGSGGGSFLSPEEEAIYWRWAGWKARGYAVLAARIRARLREVNPTGRLLIETHNPMVNGPLAALEQYGEDLAELLQRTGGTIVVRREGAGDLSLLDPLAQQTGATDRLWLGVAALEPEGASLGERVRATLATVPEQGSWNLVVRLSDAARFP
ncbi:tetratricopeptide repeat protein [Nitrospira sp. NS4]|uniref:tetratricopeptide repeat protein n=1 Tax=Nitrospira sp. NS4 TaxID=3414498 RepID=UPI003C2E67F7